MFRRARGVTCAAAVCLLATLAFGIQRAGATGPGNLIVGETFTGSTVASTAWTDLGSSVYAPTEVDGSWNGGNVFTPCLTNPAASTTATPIPGCGFTSGSDSENPDPASPDGLLLTQDQESPGQVGGVAYDTALPTDQGLFATFDAYQWGGSGADGINFFLSAVDPSATTVTRPTLGGDGGALGYTPGPATNPSASAGLSDAYLGFGLDSYGNYSNTTYDGSGCSGDSGTGDPNSITVRGPGNGTSGYCILDSVSANESFDPSPQTGIPVALGINPSGAPVNESVGEGIFQTFQIPQGDWAIAVASPKANGSSGVCPSGYICESGPLPTDTGLSASWLNPASNIPADLVFGFAASTGASDNYHLINNFNAYSLQTAPTYGLTLTPSTGSSSVMTNQSFTYSAVATVGSNAETDPVTITDTLQSGLNPNATGDQISGGGVTNTCSGSGSTETCTLTPPPGGFAPGTQITAVFGATVTATGTSPQTLTDNATVESPDSYPATSTSTNVNYSPAVLVFTTEPVNSQVNQVMQSGGSPLAVQVAVEPPGGGPPITTFTGNVSLSVVDNAGDPPGTEFFTATGDTSTLAAPLVNGVATFIPFGLNQVGGGYQVQASTTGLVPVSSTPFDSDQAVQTCGSGATCTTTVTASTGTSATLLSGPGGSGTITASFGTTPDALPGCGTGTTGTATENILSFTSNRLEVIAYSMLNAYASSKSPYQNFQVCFGAANDDFITSSGQPAAAYTGPDPGIKWEGYLPSCIQTFARQPCVIGELKIGTTQDVAILASGLDPKISLNPPAL